ncbi:phage head morphogenesis protein [Pseudoroseicyclus sp. H15]
MPETAFGGIFGRPFLEQLIALKLRTANLVPTAAWDDLWQEQHQRAFAVAGATKADLLADLAEAIEKAVAQGTTFDTFKRDFRRIVEDNGWHGWTGEGTAAGEEWRMRTIYRTNIRTSYQAGRFAQLKAGGFKFWVYRHSGAVEPRLDHLSWDGLVLPAGHPFWTTHFPPNGWGCGCEVRGAMSLASAVIQGGDLTKTLPEDWNKIDPRTGAPAGVGKGWAYAPGADVADDVNRIAAAVKARVPKPIGEALLAAIAEEIGRAA